MKHMFKRMLALVLALVMLCLVGCTPQQDSQPATTTTPAPTEDYSDIPAIKHAKKNHNASEIRVVKKMREAGHDGLIVGASGCALCTPCVQTQGLPCNFPDLKYSCMSAYCIFVKKLADACGMEYDCGEGLLGLFGMYVFD